MATIRRIQTRKQIKDHLLHIYQSQPDIVVSCNNGIPLKINRFIYAPDRPDEILLKTDTLSAPSAKVGVTYFLGGFEHYFESRILSFKQFDKTGAFLKIYLPSSVRAVNRRNYLRLYPDCRDTILVTLDLPDHGPVTCPVQDISAGGFSFLMPDILYQSLVQSEVEVELRLPEDFLLSAAAIFRNALINGKELRIGAEFKDISYNAGKLLTDYIVRHIVNNKSIPAQKKHDRHPTVCLIQDNCNSDKVLSYLAPPYHLIRQNLNADWTPMARIKPDALLFNLDSISPASLLPKLRALTNLQHTPVIILADTEVPLTCDATLLCQLKDPAILIETIDRAIMPVAHNGLIINPYIISSPSKALPLQTILILDLKGTISQKVIAGIESKGYGVSVVTQLGGILETIKNIRPVLIVIAADFDATLNNLFRMLGINRHSRAIPLALLAEPNGTAHGRNYPSDISMLRNDMEANELTRHLIEIIEH